MVDRRFLRVKTMTKEQRKNLELGIDRKCMTDKHIVNTIVRETGVSQELAYKILDLIFSEIKRGCFKLPRHMVQIRNFGCFKLKFLGQRAVAHHYITGDNVVVDAHMKICFLAYSDIRKRLYRKELRRRKEEHDALKAAEKAERKALWEAEQNDNSNAESGGND